MRLLLVTVISFILSACGTTGTQQSSTYIPPKSSDYANEVIMPYGYDESWKKLVNAASQSFFAIENFEKDSGLMTLSFGSNDIYGSIDCGSMNGQQYTSFWLARGGSGKVDLQGKMNLLVQEIDENSTKVRVSARYIVSMTASGYTYNFFTSQNQYWSQNLNMSFDSNSMGSDSVQVNGTSGSPVRYCAPTGKIEQTVIDSVKSS